MRCFFVNVPCAHTNILQIIEQSMSKEQKHRIAYFLTSLFKQHCVVIFSLRCFLFFVYPLIVEHTLFSTQLKKKNSTPTKIHNENIYRKVKKGKEENKNSGKNKQFQSQRKAIFCGKNKKFAWINRPK